MKDFTLRAYTSLIEAFLSAGYRITTVQGFLREKPEGKVLVLRHDVDEQPQNALEMARVEHRLGVNATYYFRRVPKSDHPDIIRLIASMGHEIGYHYEDLSKANGEMDKALESFGKNLEYFRQYYPVSTVCMHGSSSSQYDNKALWTKARLADYDLIGEPYLSFDFGKVFYLSDTGYAWDGGKFAVRDYIQTSFPLSFHSTDQVIGCVLEGRFPVQAQILAHTLWTDNPLLWNYLHFREFIRNRVKLLSRKSRFVSAIYKKLVTLYWK